MGSVMAVMAVIGGIDGRLRLGGQVLHEEHGEGTVTRITPKGRITVQFHEMRTCRVCLLSHLKPVCVLLRFISIYTSVLLFPLNRLMGNNLVLKFFFFFVISSAAGSKLQCAKLALHGAHAWSLGPAGQSSRKQTGETAHEKVCESRAYRY